MVDDIIAERVRSLAQAFAVSGLARLTMRDADFELELRRTPDAPPAPLAPPVATNGANGTALAATAPAEKKPDIVKSDLVGIVRLSRPTVIEGNVLDHDRELAFVETLGIRNPVRSRGTGTVTAVYVTDGQPVEYGQPLFAIQR